MSHVTAESCRLPWGYSLVQQHEQGQKHGNIKFSKLLQTLYSRHYGELLIRSRDWRVEKAYDAIAYSIFYSIMDYLFGQAAETYYILKKELQLFRKLRTLSVFNNTILIDVWFVLCCFIRIRKLPQCLIRITAVSQ